MKTIPADLVNCGTLVWGVRIKRRDGVVLAYTEHDVDQTVTIDDLTSDEIGSDDVGSDGFDTLLLSNPGFNIQSLSSTAGLGVDNTDVYLMASDDITRAMILARGWDGAQVYFFRYSWKKPGAGIIPMKRGSFGNLAPQLGQFKVEFRDLRQGIQQNTTWLFQETCRWRLGDKRCRKDLTAFTFEVEVTGVTSAYAFTCADLDGSDFPDDFFGEGSVHWLEGANADTPGNKVRSSVAGLITLSEAVIRDIEIGDRLRIVAGCRKRWDEDCKTKFDNLPNFGGEKDKPTRDELIAPPTPIAP